MIHAAERLAVDVADAQALKARAASGDQEALRAAARQFEAMVVAQMLKTMRETRFSDEDDPMTGGDGVKLYRDLLDQQWASRIASGRGLGFADMMIRAMERPASIEAAPASDTTGAAVPTARSVAARASAASFLVGAEDEAPAATMAAPVAPSIPRAEAAGTVAERKRAFLEAMRPHAEAAEAATGIPARFILAQAALESGWGEREIRAADGSASHNLFGIKAGRSWGGADTEVTTTEYRQGVAMKLTQRFRAYEDYTAGFSDYARLLESRYDAAVAGARKGDAEAFAEGLAAGGYATDPAYAGKLKSVIASVAMAGV